MPKKKLTPKSNATKPQRAGGCRRPSAGSAPLRLIRLVVQLNDTKHNRNVMDKLQDAARLSAVESPYASIKREDVTIVALLTTKPEQNS